jgi:hypothetical protein
MDWPVREIPTDKEVARDPDKKARGGGSGSAGADIGCDRGARPEDLLDDLPHGGVQPAGCVEDQDHERMPGFVRPVEGIADILGGHGMDRGVHGDAQDPGKAQG